jgi:hypothetical protein
MKTLERQLRHSNAERWNDKIYADNQIIINGENHMTTVAFKCTYNNGGSESGYVGFSGACSRDNIVTNIKYKIVMVFRVMKLGFHKNKNTEDIK